MPGIQKREINEEMNKTTQTEISFIDVDDSIDTSNTDLLKNMFASEKSNQHQNVNNKNEVLDIKNKSEENLQEFDDVLIKETKTSSNDLETKLKPENSLKNIQEPKSENLIAALAAFYFVGTVFTDHIEEPN